MNASQAQLFLFRHAKSSWAEPGTKDEDRPLSQRGIADAMAMGKHMAKAELIPDRVLCSTARRTRETWEIVARELPSGSSVEFVQAAYDFGDGSQLLSVIRAGGGICRKLMLVGHNPAIQGLAMSLVGFGDQNLREKLEHKYPTGALAHISFASLAWSETKHGSGTLLHFVRPGDLSARSGD